MTEVSRHSTTTYNHTTSRTRSMHDGKRPQLSRIHFTMYGCTQPVYPVCFNFWSQFVSDDALASLACRLACPLAAALLCVAALCCSNSSSTVRLWSCKVSDVGKGDSVRHGRPPQSADGRCVDVPIGGQACVSTQDELGRGVYVHPIAG